MEVSSRKVVEGLHTFLYGAATLQPARRDLRDAIERTVGDCKRLRDEWAHARYADYATRPQWKRLIIGAWTWPW